jgi:hypothetical protein
MTQPTYPAGLPTPGHAYAPPPPRRRSNRAILGGVIGAIAGLAGAGVGAWFLFATPTLDETKVEAEIVRATEALGLTPTDVVCPADIPVAAERVDVCTATLEGQQVRYTVRQTDDQGNVAINSSGFVVVSQVEQLLVDRVGAQSGIDVVAECADGARVVVGGAGTTVDCVVSDAANPADFAEFTGTVTDDQGTVDFN